MALTKDDKELLTQLKEKLDRNYEQQEKLTLLLKSLPGALKRLLIKMLTTEEEQGGK